MKTSSSIVTKIPSRMIIMHKIVILFPVEEVTLSKTKMESNPALIENEYLLNDKGLDSPISIMSRSVSSLMNKTKIIKRVLLF